MRLNVLKPVFADSASELVQAANQFEDTILIKKGHWSIDAKSLLGVLALSLQPGDTIELATDNEEIVSAFLELNFFSK
ncbi:HPr family phosphocarrier protein [Bacillus lacus]|uniref:HPr family phosphocarrier protein n=1 Tax=Metabacillus lacus TaxID=1983721 RepID=A0A7X2J2Q8_9BACI|nr:HPr family phosphocarrier protein [Metabacillus lacus]